MRQGRLTSCILFLAGLACAFAGQFYFTSRRLYARDGILLWCLAAVFLGALVIRLRRQGAVVTERPSAHEPASTWRIGLAILGLVLSAMAGMAARSLPAEADFAVPLVTWLAGIVSFLLACVPTRRAPPKGTAKQRLAAWAQRLRGERRGTLMAACGVGALVVAALAEPD